MRYSEAEITIEQKELGEMVWLARVAVTSSVGTLLLHARVRTSDEVLYMSHSLPEDVDAICTETIDLFPPEYRGVKRMKRIREVALQALSVARTRRITSQKWTPKFLKF